MESNKEKFKQVVFVAESGNMAKAMFELVKNRLAVNINWKTTPTEKDIEQCNKALTKYIESHDNYRIASAKSIVDAPRESFVDFLMGKEV